MLNKKILKVFIAFVITICGLTHTTTTFAIQSISPSSFDAHYSKSASENDYGEIEIVSYSYAKSGIVRHEFKIKIDNIAIEDIDQADPNIIKYSKLLMPAGKYQIQLESKSRNMGEQTTQNIEVWVLPKMKITLVYDPTEVTAKQITVNASSFKDQLGIYQLRSQSPSSNDALLRVFSKNLASLNEFNTEVAAVREGNKKRQEETYRNSEISARMKEKSKEEERLRNEKTSEDARKTWRSQI